MPAGRIRVAARYLIAYLWFFSDPHVVFENHAFHEIAIAAATSKARSSPT